MHSTSAGMRHLDFLRVVHLKEMDDDMNNLGALGL